MAATRQCPQRCTNLCHGAFDISALGINRVDVGTSVDGAPSGVALQDLQFGLIMADPKPARNKSL